MNIEYKKLAKIIENGEGLCTNCGENDLKEDLKGGSIICTNCGEEREGSNRENFIPLYNEKENEKVDTDKEFYTSLYIKNCENFSVRNNMNGCLCIKNSNLSVIGNVLCEYFNSDNVPHIQKKFKPKETGLKGEISNIVIEGDIKGSVDILNCNLFVSGDVGKIRNCTKSNLEIHGSCKTIENIHNSNVSVLGDVNGKIKRSSNSEIEVNGTIKGK